jgi:hypothetical protein
MTPTKTITPTKTPTPSITPTKTVTPTITPTKTPTPSITPTNAPNCPTKVLVFEVCNSNAQKDDNFNVFLNNP